MFGQAEFLLSAPASASFPPDSGAEVAFSGRSNSGKSSTLNVITGRRGLARTSKTPGRTQLINFFTLSDEYRLVDLPGYGFAKVPDRIRAQWRGLLEGYFAERRSLRGLVVVTDARRPLMDFDLQMIAWARGAGCALHILVNKADKLRPSEARQTLARVQKELGPDVGVQLFSALKRQGVDEARSAVEALLARPVESP